MSTALRRAGLIRTGLVCAAAAAAASCAQSQTSTGVFNLDRPSAISFACWGDLRITNGDPATPDQEVVRSPQPVIACTDRLDDTVPDGQEPIDGVVSPQSVSFAAFVLQPTKGSLAVIQMSADSTGFSSGGLIDADPYTPGRSAVPVGTLPVDVATTTDSCYAVTANAGSCDLSVLDVDSALNTKVPAQVKRVQVVNASGDPVLARPVHMVAEPMSTDVGYACPAEPQGVVYIAYPDCNLVAAVDPATGTIVSGIHFGDGTIDITDGNVTCDNECGDGAETAAARQAIGGPGRPVALEMAKDGKRLYIGAENLPEVVIVDLDDSRLPTAVSQVDLDGQVGVLELVASPKINMGGGTGVFGSGTAGQMQFVYAIATDATVRVAEVLNEMTECDTQVDPRYLHDVRDVSFLSCMPVGDPSTPPRRPDARSPGIHIPRVRSLVVRDWENIPLDLAIAGVDANSGAVVPTSMVGYFAFITASDGAIYIANIDDDNYPDFEDPTDPSIVSMPLALAHQLRDFVPDRGAVAGADGEPSLCNTAGPDSSMGGPRLNGGDITQIFDNGVVDPSKTNLLPYLRTEVCDPNPDTSGDEIPVNELSFAASKDVREAAYPDLMALRNEVIRLDWEGRISLDSSDVNIDGPVTRTGMAQPNADSITLRDGSAPFCKMGVEPYDFVNFVGCDPSRGDTQCGIGETCFVHPETPEVLLGSGSCVPEDEVDRLSVDCRDFFITARNFSVMSTKSDELTLVPRRVVLDTTPVDGCSDDNQCTDYYNIAVGMASPDEPYMQMPSASPPSFTCGEDPSRKPGKSWCMLRCDADGGCPDGTACDAGGFCDEGVVPPAECVSTLQRYQTRVGEAFAVVGQQSGFLNNRIVDENTGECIDDPNGNPLNVGRVPLTAPPCAGDGPADISPNPCSETVSQAEIYTPFADDGNCTAEKEAVRVRDVPSIRVDLRGVRFHVVKPTTQGDETCIDDAAGTRPAFSAVHRLFQLRVEIIDGFIPMLVAPSVSWPTVLTPGPDRHLWLLDQGDQSSSTQGQVYRINPSEPSSGFTATRISTGS